MFVDDADNMYGVDAAILMNQKVWQASGHVDTFTDRWLNAVMSQQIFEPIRLISPSVQLVVKRYVW